MGNRMALVWLTLFGLTANVFADGDAIIGQWYTEDDSSRVLVYEKQTGDGETRYFGKIVWLKDPLYEKDDPEAGKPLHDRENPDESLRGRPLIGLTILKNFEYNAEAEAWESGTIYDPETGKTYKCKMTLVQDDSLPEGQRLDVRGYVGVPLFGRTTAWRPVPDADLEDEQSPPKGGT